MSINPESADYAAIQPVALPAGKDFSPRRCGDSAEIHELSEGIRRDFAEIVMPPCWRCRYRLHSLGSEYFLVAYDKGHQEEIDGDP